MIESELRVKILLTAWFILFSLGSRICRIFLMPSLRPDIVSIEIQLWVCIRMFLFIAWYLWSHECWIYLLVQIQFGIKWVFYVTDSRSESNKTQFSIIKDNKRNDYSLMTWWVTKISTATRPYRYDFIFSCYVIH